MAIIQYAMEYWTEFDGWCLTNGVDPLVMPSRRFFSAVWRFMTEGLDEEQYNKLNTQLDQAVYEAEAEARSRTRQKVSKEEKTEEDGDKKFVPVSRWQMPPGWQPPGWSDEAAYKNSMAGMMGVTSTGGGKIGGAVK